MLIRALLVTVLLAAVGAGLVVLKGKIVQCSHRVHRLHQRRMTLRQELWSRQMDLARGRVPARIRRRVIDMGLDVFEPRVPRRAAHAPEAHSNGIVRTHD